MQTDTNVHQCIINLAHQTNNFSEWGAHKHAPKTITNVPNTDVSLLSPVGCMWEISAGNLRQTESCHWNYHQKNDLREVDQDPSVPSWADSQPRHDRSCATPPIAWFWVDPRSSQVKEEEPELPTSRALLTSVPTETFQNHHFSVMDAVDCGCKYWNSQVDENDTDLLLVENVVSMVNAVRDMMS